MTTSDTSRPAACKKSLRAGLREGKASIRDAVKGPDARQRRLRQWQFALARQFTEVVVVEAGDKRWFVSTADRHVGLELFMYGAFEAAQMKVAFDVLGRTVGDPFKGGPKTFVDIGANIGTASIQAVLDHRAMAAVAYEPEARNFELLQHNVLANAVGTQVKCIRAAVSNRVGESELSLASDNSGDHRLVTGHEQNDWGEAKRPTSIVEVTTLDLEIERGRIALDEIGMLWIDTQGHELRVLEGATQVASSSVPVVIEYWPYGLAAAGGAEALNAFVAEHFAQVVDLSRPYANSSLLTHQPESLDKLARELDEEDRWTDLLLLS